VFSVLVQLGCETEVGCELDKQAALMLCECCCGVADEDQGPDSQ